MRKLIFTTILTFLISFLFAQKPKLSIQVFKRDTSFSCLASDSNGNIYVGTGGKRIYRYKDGQWKNFSWGINGLLSWLRTGVRQMAVRNNVLWVAHNGFVFNNSGDVDYYRYGGIESINLANGPNDRTNRRGQRIINVDLTIAGPNTRNTVGVFPDENGRVWSASQYADSVAYPELYNYNARYWYKTGGVATKEPGVANFFRKETAYPAPFNIGVGTNMAGAESNSIGKRKSSYAITPDPDSNEILISCDGYQAVGDVLFTAGIMRYNRTTGAYIGKYDVTNTPIPFGNTNESLGSTAMYTDVKGQIWVTLGGGRIARRDTSGWRFLGAPTVLPTGSQYLPHSVTGDKKGRIYFGTDNGLLVYNANDTTAYNDSLFYFYTAVDGLPSNYVRATHIDKFGTLWLGTSNGVCKILVGDLQMYTLKPTITGIYNNNDASQRSITTSFDPKPTSTDTARIAADGTASTLFKWIGRDPQKLKFRIKEDVSNNVYELGELTEVARTNDSIVYAYKHPAALLNAYVAPGKRNITLQIRDTTTTPPTIVLESNLAIVKPPVMLLHGLWSSGSTFDSLKQYLVDNANYKKFMIGTPSYKKDVSYTENQFVGKEESEKLLSFCSLNGMSAGKVDVVTHSMGGPVARLSLQSPAFTNTYHKLITLNAPHAGTQNSNFVFSNVTIQTVFRVLASSSNNIDNGALRDMGVNSFGTISLLNAPGNLNRKVVPTHAIVSDFTLFEQAQYPEMAAELSLFAFTPTRGYLALAKLALFQGSSCFPTETIHSCLKNKIYKDDHDLNVPVGSQKGGLPSSAITKFDNIFHNGTIAPQSPVFSWLKYLLQERADAPVFTTNGFSPPTLTYEGPFGSRETNTESVLITSPATGSSFPAGATINVVAQGSSNINRLLLITGNDVLGMDFKDTSLQNATFSYQIPNNAVGRLYIAAMGNDAQGKSVMDTTFINVTPPAGVTLDSIQIVNKTILRVEKGDSLQLQIKGFYSDRVRDISYLSGINYTFDDVNAKASIVAANSVIGVTEGYDKFAISYLGKTDTGYIEVVERTTISGIGLPVKLISFTGNLNNNAVQLNWTTAQELNNAYFEIERSNDGISFTKLGRVNSRGNSTNALTYSFTDFSNLTNTNYYRLKQVDADGQFSYSNIVLIRLAKASEPQIILFPNPASHQFTVHVAEGTHATWQLQLTNLVGQTIVTKTIAANQNNQKISLAGVAAGVYVVVIKEENNQTIFYKGKLVVTH